MLNCSHPQALVIDTGWLIHIFCDCCGGYCTTILDSAIDAANRSATRPHRMITVDGITHSITDWSKINGINPGTIRNRLCKGWSERGAVMTPVGGSKN